MSEKLEKMRADLAKAKERRIQLTAALAAAGVTFDNKEDMDESME